MYFAPLRVATWMKCDILMSFKKLAVFIVFSMHLTPFIYICLISSLKFSHLARLEL